jgi:hypothetical protein
VTPKNCPKCGGRLIVTGHKAEVEFQFCQECDRLFVVSPMEPEPVEFDPAGSTLH